MSLVNLNVPGVAELGMPRQALWGRESGHIIPDPYNMCLCQNILGDPCPPLSYARLPLGVDRLWSLKSTIDKERSYNLSRLLCALFMFRAYQQFVCYGMLSPRCQMQKTSTE